jgi:hypothetical protein
MHRLLGQSNSFAVNENFNHLAAAKQIDQAAFDYDSFFPTVRQFHAFARCEPLVVLVPDKGAFMHHGAAQFFYTGFEKEIVCHEELSVKRGRAAKVAARAPFGCLEWLDVARTVEFVKESSKTRC